jgi:hypothetical protein
VAAGEKPLRERLRWAEWSTRVLAWLGIIAIGVGVTRAFHFELLGRSPLAEMTTLYWFEAGIAFILLHVVVWSLLHVRRRSRRSIDSVTQAALLADAVDDFDVVATTLLLVDTESYIPRATEEILVGDGYYEHRLRAHWILPSERDDKKSREYTVLIPVVRNARGALIDQFRVTDAAGRLLPTLNSREFLGATETVLTVLLEAVLDCKIKKDEKSEPRRLLDWLLDEIRKDGPLPGSRRALKPLPRTANKLQEFLSRATLPDVWAKQPDEWQTLVQRVVQFSEAVRDTHIVFVRFTGRPSTQVSIRHSYIRQHIPSDIKRRQLFRYWLGIRPHTHDITLLEHRLAQSYHFSFRAPLDQYVYSCTVEAVDEPGDGNIVTSPLEGSGARDYAHVHVRQAILREGERRKRSPLLVRLDCREKAPGLLGVVAVIAIAQMFLIWIIGAFHSFYFPEEAAATANTLAKAANAAVAHAAALKAQAHEAFRLAARLHGSTHRHALLLAEQKRQLAVASASQAQHANALAHAAAIDAAKNSGRTDVPALLLALPGIAAAWLGAQFTSEKLRATSIATVLGLLFAGILAIGSTAGAVAKDAGGFLGAGLQVEHPAWLIIMLASLALATDLSVRVIVRCFRFASRINHPGLYRRELL